MKFKWLLAIALPAVLSLLEVSCTTSKTSYQDPAAAGPGGQQTKKTYDPQSLEAQEKLIEAKKMEILGDDQQALNLYKECIKIDPRNDAAYYNAARIFFDLKQYPDALAYITQAVKINPSNQWYLDLYGTLLGGMGNFKEAARVYEQMVQQNPDNADAWFNWAFFLDQDKQTENAINVFNKIEERFGVSEDISMEKEKLWVRLGKPEKAADELRKLIDAYPNEPRYYSILVDLYMSNKMEDKAAEVLQEMIKIDPDNPAANLVMADYYRTKGDEEKSFESLKKAFDNPELEIGVKLPILAGFIPAMQNNTAKQNQAMQLGESLVKVHFDDARSFAIYGDILYQSDKPDSALNQYKKSLELDNSKFLVWQQVMFLYDRDRQYDSLLAVSNRAVELFPDQNMAYYFNGYANMQLNRYKDAVDALGKAVAIGSEDKQFIAQIYSSMGDAWYNLNNHSASDSCYELALVFDPNNAYVLNNYSYYLSVRGEKLDEAKKMAERANFVSPGNAAYQDTYAWVLYKLGNYDQAKQWLDKAIQSGGETDGTILEHYGDVLFHLGDVSGAVEYWQKAKDKKVDSDTIDKKIADRKLYE